MPPKSKPSSLQVHKFGGASLSDAAAVRHAASIIAGQRGPRLVVASAMAGVTDALLAGATGAAAGDADALVDAAATLRTRHVEAARALVKERARRTALEGAIAELSDELEQLARGLAVLRELTPRTSDTSSRAASAWARGSLRPHSARPGCAPSSSTPPRSS